MITTSTKGDGTLLKIYTDPDFLVISAMIDGKNHQTPFDSAVKDPNTPQNAAPAQGLQQPTDDLMLVIFNELEDRFRTSLMGFVYGVLVRDGYQKYIHGEKGPSRHYGRALKTEDDILAAHSPDTACAARHSQGTAADDKKLDMSRRWCDDNRVTIRPSCAEVRAMYEMMNYFEKPYRDVLIQLLHDAVMKYLEAGKDRLPNDHPPKATDRKGGAM